PSRSALRRSPPHPGPSVTSSKHSAREPVASARGKQPPDAASPNHAGRRSNADISAEVTPPDQESTSYSRSPKGSSKTATNSSTSPASTPPRSAPDHRSTCHQPR